MDSDAERQVIRKSMAYDLIHILEADSTKETYTPAELKKIIYTLTTEQISHH